MAAVVGCSDDDSDSLGTNGRKSTKGTTDDTTKTNTGTSGGTNTDGTPTVSAAITACQAVAAPKQLSTDKDVTDVTIAGTAVFYQSGSSINRVFKVGTNQKTIFTSPKLTHFWADKKGLLVIENTDPNNPNTTTLRTFPATTTDADGNPVNPDFPEYPIQEGDNPGGATSNTGFQASGVNIFAADDNNYYLLVEDGANQVILQVNRNDPNARAQVMNTNGTAKVLSAPQLASSAVWWVEDNEQIVKAALDENGAPQAPKGVFGTEQHCNLAVSEQNIFCTPTDGSMIESRTLTGSEVKTVMPIAASKIAAAPFGDPRYIGAGTLVVLNSKADTVDLPVKNVIRSVSTPGGEEKLVACGREQVTLVTADTTDIVWAEKTTGVYITPR